MIRLPQGVSFAQLLNFPARFYLVDRLFHPKSIPCAGPLIFICCLAVQLERIEGGQSAIDRYHAELQSAIHHAFSLSNFSHYRLPSMIGCPSFEYTRSKVIHIHHQQAIDSSWLESAARINEIASMDAFQRSPDLPPNSASILKSGRPKSITPAVKPRLPDSLPARLLDPEIATESL